MTAVKIVAHAPEIVVDRLVSIVVAMNAAIRNYVEPGLLLIKRDGSNCVLESFAVHRVWRLAVAAEMARKRRIPPARVGVIADHACWNKDFLPADLHVAPPFFNV